MAHAWKRTLAVLGCCGALALVAPTSVSAEPIPSTTPQETDWLADVNAYREMSGLAPVGETPALSSAAASHSCYMLLNEMTHEQIPGRPGHTAAGAEAGERSNVAVHSSTGVADRVFVDLWMSGPFHAIPILHPGLSTVGFGRCEDSSAPRWRTGASLDVMTHRRPAVAAPRRPIFFPGDGSTTYLRQFIAETPDPRSFCGWPTGATDVVGLPTIAMLPEAFGREVTAGITGPGGSLESCTLTRFNTTDDASSILAAGNAVVVIPRRPLVDGRYTVTVTAGGREVTWSFTVDENAPLGRPAAVASPSERSSGFEPMTPRRLVDTREHFGATPLQAGVVRELPIAGRAGVPAGISAVSANATVVVGNGGGFLTLWPCHEPRPDASTLNFAPGETVANAATLRLDPGGRLCAFSTSDADLVLDVNGIYGVGGTVGFVPVGPSRVMDTRRGLGAPGAVAAGTEVRLPVAGTGGVPAGSRAVTMNVTSTNARGGAGFVTVYPCDAERPTTSNLNPRANRDRPNLVVTPLAADGTVCFWSLFQTDLVVDVTGYLANLGGEAPTTFTSTTPFRFLDTRDPVRASVNAGTRGEPLQAGQVLEVPVAGLRGIAADATGLSLNLTITDPEGTGFLTAWPCGPLPLASTANFRRGEIVANAAQLPLSADGSLCIFSPVTTHVVIDVNGWWS
jgi:hypothetical protein